MSKLLASCPQCPSAHLPAVSAIEARVPDQHKGSIGEVIKAGLAAGIPWGALLAFVAKDLPLLLSMLSGGINVSEIVTFIQDLIAAVSTPVTP